MRFDLACREFLKVPCFAAAVRWLNLYKFTCVKNAVAATPKQVILGVNNTARVLATANCDTGLCDANAGSGQYGLERPRLALESIFLPASAF